MTPFNIIVAVDRDLGIGKAGGLPWRLSADLKHFKEITTRVRSSGARNAVIMGRKTWDSLPPAYRPLPGRLNIVISGRAEGWPADVLRAADLDGALRIADAQVRAGKIEQIFVIGGGQVFAQALAHPLCQNIYLTRIDRSFGCDVFFPGDLSRYVRCDASPLYEESALPFFFEKWTISPQH